MTDKERDPLYVVFDIPRALQLFCPPGAKMRVEKCSFNCDELKDCIAATARVYDILMEVQKDGCHAIGCRFVKSWPFKGKCNCFQARIKRELER